MKAIRDRLNWDLVVKHPVTPNETITDGSDDPKAKLLREKLSDALSWLEPLFEPDCTRENALKCWDKVFATKYFGDRLGKEDQSAKAAASVEPTILTTGLLKETASSAGPRDAVQKEGGGRYA
jgi:hypothetical protein